jgi:hypothetical protein
VRPRLRPDAYTNRRLITHTELMMFHFTFCRLGSVTAASIAQYIAGMNCCLTTIDLSGNKLDDGDAAILRKALETNPNSTVTTLDLRNNAGIVSDRLELLWSCKYSMVQLYLCCCRMSRSGVSEYLCADINCLLLCCAAKQSRRSMRCC